MKKPPPGGFFIAERVVFHKGYQEGPYDREHKKYEHFHKTWNQYQKQKSAAILLHMNPLPLSSLSTETVQ